MMPGPPCFRISAVQVICRLSASVPLSLHTSPLSMGESPVSLRSTSSSIFKIFASVLVCNCTAPCSIPSIVCGLLCLMLRVCPSHFQLSSYLFVAADSDVSEC